MAHPKLTPQALMRFLQTNAHGRDRAKTVAWLADQYGVGGKCVREIIHDLRLAGHLIGSGASGIYVPRSRGEAVAGFGHLVKRVRSVAEVYESQRSAVDRAFPSQPGLFDQPLPAAADLPAMSADDVDALTSAE